MDIILHDIVEFIGRYRDWSPIVMGIVMFGESLFVVGLFVPATALMLAAGGLIASGDIDPIPLIACTVLGTIAGDTVSYSLGWRCGRRILRTGWARRHRHRTAHARAFFRKYGAASVFVGRFLGPLRSTVPFIAGTMRMDVLRFQIVNVVSAVVWVPSITLPSFLIAKGVTLI